MENAMRLSNQEILGRYFRSTKSASASDKAQRVLDYLGEDIGQIFRTEPEELVDNCQLTLRESEGVLYAIELGRRIVNAPPKEKVDITSPAELASIFRSYMCGMPAQEHMVVALFNAKFQLYGTYTASTGGLTGTSASPREVFATAIRKGAYAIAVAHNHPSGIADPSAADIAMTKTLISAGRILGIEMADHIVLGDQSYASIRTAIPSLWEGR